MSSQTIPVHGFALMGCPLYVGFNKCDNDNEIKADGENQRMHRIQYMEHEQGFKFQIKCHRTQHVTSNSTLCYHSYNQLLK